ncbi:IPT/TIG domain-containing protein [Pontibacter arcticus]|nr:IPT/TIG domain-containing protein [Pontibacter arcticus]
MKLYIFRSPFLLIIFSFLLLQGCEKEDEQIHPEIKTMQITALSPSSATLEGNIIHTGKFPVLDFGFVYGLTPELGETMGTRLSLGKDAKPGTYKQDVKNLKIASGYYTSNHNFYARAYLTNEKGTVFGQVASVTLPSPNIQSIVPNTGKAGDKITISGSFFTSDATEVEVLFANVAGKVIEVSPSKVVVEVPSGITSSSYYDYRQVGVVLKMAGQTYNVTSTFKVNPSVTDFSPKSATLGTVITIKGNNLPGYYYYSNLRVSFGEVDVPITSYSSTGIQVQVPHHIGAKKVPLSVIIDGVKTTLPGDFTVIPHTVTSIAPTSGLSGSYFSLTGDNFPSDFYYNYNQAVVTVGDIPTTISYVSSGEMLVLVPFNLKEGNHKIKVAFGPTVIEATQQFSVVASSITSFSPTSGGIGREVILKGNFLPDTYYIVNFGSVRIGGYSTSSSTIQTSVPQGATLGAVKISVENDYTKIEAKDEFTVLAPTFTAFSPSSGVAGSVVTITGSGFSANAYTVVRFGTVSTNILSITDTTIKAVVPSNVTGAMKITVLQNGQTMISKDNFTVTN